jgi:magnesium-protoporphyrin IX monomethyl ester (oxidative) cyclase
MNCLNFVYRPEGFASRTEMDALYNWHVRRFYDSRRYRRRFARRLWAHRASLWHILRHLPQVIRAGRYFSGGRSTLAELGRNFQAHPRQPRGLAPFLSPELRVDAIAALSPQPIRRRIAMPSKAIILTES